MVILQRAGALRRLFAALTKIVCVALFMLCMVTIAGSALGWRLVPVLSGSMRPILQPGDLILSKPLAAEDVSPGQVIIFKAPIPGQPTIVHRVLTRSADGEFITFQTKGDANNRQDDFQLLLSGSTKVAAVEESVPGAGFAVHWVAQAGPVVMTLFIVLGLLMSFSLIAVWKPREKLEASNALPT